MTLSEAELVQKYDINAPRYTSYPPVPFWNKQVDQQAWLSSINEYYQDQRGVDVYIHVPYCEQLCYFCGCHKEITKNKSKGAAYVDILKKEWAIYLKHQPNLKVNALHFGGGTPNFLSAEEFDDLLTFILEGRKQKDFLGSIEVDPRTGSEDQYAVLNKHGFARLSMGVQDFNLKVMTVVNRVQPYELVAKQIAFAEKHGFTSINFDLIYGLPYQTVETVSDTVKRVIDMQPEQIAFYSYAYLPERIKSQKIHKEDHLPLGNEKKRLYEVGKELLENHGYFEIGLDHFALKGSILEQAFHKETLYRSFMGYTESLSNILIGLGVSSIGNSPWGMVQNEKQVDELEKILETGELPIKNGHINEGDDLVISSIIQKLMCRHSFKWSDVKALEDVDRIAQDVKEFVTDGILTHENGTYKLTKQGKPFLRNVCTLFDYYLHRKKTDVTFSRTI